MSVPVAVADIFEKITADRAELAGEIAGIDEVALAQTNPDAIVRTILLADTAGRVPVVIPQSGMLDLDSLNRQLSRELRAIPREDVNAITQNIKWYQLPVLPDLTGSKVILDRSILKYEEVFLPSLDSGQFLRLQRKLLEDMLGEFSVLDIGVNKEGININRLDIARDIPQIHDALSSFTKLRICARLEDTLEIPPLPETAQRIIKLRADEDAGICELSDLVETDPSLAAQVVSWASSSFYAAPGKINSVYDAILRVLGFDLVMNLAMGMALGKTLNIPEDAPEGIVSYWEQAVWMATVSGVLSSNMPESQRPEFGLIYLSGLLHNYGYLVLAHVFPPHFSLLNRYSEVNNHCDTELCDQHLLGITREQIASQLMLTWNMPDEVVAALRHQKNPEYQGEYATYSRLLFVVTQFMRKNQMAHGPVQTVPECIWEALQITPANAEEVFDEMLSMADEIKGLAGYLERVS